MRRCQGAVAKYWELTSTSTSTSTMGSHEDAKPNLQARMMPPGWFNRDNVYFIGDFRDRLRVSDACRRWAGLELSFN